MNTPRRDDRTTWSYLLDEGADGIREDLEFQNDTPEQIREMPSSSLRGVALGGPDETVSGALVVLDPSAAQPLVQGIAPLLDAVIGELDAAPRSAHWAQTAVWTLSYLNALRCAGMSVPARAIEIESAWMADLVAFAPDLSDAQQHTIALIALATRATGFVPGILGHRAEPPFTAGERFGLNVQGFILYLTSAIESRAPYEDVEAAWLDFVHAFPVKRATQMLGWPALLFAARTVFCVIDTVPVDEVGAELHRLVTGS